MPRRFSSKRKLRQKDAERGKRQRRSDDREILTDELLQQLTGGENGGELLVVSEKKKLNKSEKKNDEGDPEFLTKAQKRKLKQLEEKKRRTDELGVIFSDLRKSRVRDDHLAVMRPIHFRGQKQTKKQKADLASKLKAMGLPVGEIFARGGKKSKVKKLKGKKGGGGEGSFLSDDDDDDDEEEELDGGVIVPEVEGKFKNSDHGLKRVEEDDDDDDLSVGKEKGSDLDDPSPLILEEKSDQISELNSNFERNIDGGMDGDYSGAFKAKALRESMGFNRHEDDEDDYKKPERRHAAVHSRHRVVHVQRSEEVESVREELPIIGVEQEIMETVSENDVMVLCGQTGCGKTTQVPQFLYEGGYGCKDFRERGGIVGVTQPRRVAAVSTAKRVAFELGSEIGDVVGYQVRYDKSVGSNTALKFMTDGILLREVQEDFILRKYSVIIIDEAHERSLNTDLLLGMLSRIVPLRRKMVEKNPNSGITPLKLIIMSATLRTEDFVGNRKLFKEEPPVINVASRQFPVTVHFSRRTELTDYVGAAYRKVCRIHRELPPGGILVFLTGQREVEFLCKKLENAFEPKKRKKVGGGGGEEGCGQGKVDVSGVSGSLNSGMNDMDNDQSDQGDTGSDGENEVLEGGVYGNDVSERLEAFENEKNFSIDDLEFDSMDDSDEEDVEVLGGDEMSPEEIAKIEKSFDDKFKLDVGDEGKGSEVRNAPVCVLPLYALLHAKKQAKVFEPPPSGSRLIVVATNVAETSITIPNIRYVVDAGRSKQKLLQHSAGISKFEVRWVSKSSGEQRAGRAGRTLPGHCYRLYSSAHFNDTFPQHTPPEIVNTPLEGVVLMMKALGVNKIANFPFPTPPEDGALSLAERALVCLAALDADDKKISDMGRAMVPYPVSPRHSRMILEAIKMQEGSGGEDLVHYAIALAAALNEQSPFVHLDTIQVEDGGNGCKGQSNVRKRARKLHDKFRCEDSDVIGSLNVLCAFERAGCSDGFCKENFMHARNLREMNALHKQLVTTLTRQNIPGVSRFLTGLDHTMALPPPPQNIVKKLRRALTAGWCDRVSRRVRSLEHLTKVREEGNLMRAVRYMPCNAMDNVYMHPNSTLHGSAPEFVVYTEVLQTVKRPYMAGITCIEPGWLPDVAPPLCKFSDPLEEPRPFYNPDADCVMCWRNVAYGLHSWELPRHRNAFNDTNRCSIAFARALLEGKVFNGMDLLKASLVMSPAMVGKPETRYHARLGGLVNGLVEKCVASKQGLLQILGKQPHFLREEVRMWVRKPHRGEVDRIWEELVSQI